MWNFQFMDNLGGKEWLARPARCCELIMLGFVSFVCDECEYTQSNLLSRSRLAGKAGWKSEIRLKSQFTCSCLPKWFCFQELSAYKKTGCPPCTMMKALQPKKVSIVKWSGQIVVLFHPFKSWQFQTSIQFYFSSFSPPAIFCWITFSHLVEFISKWN